MDAPAHILAIATQLEGHAGADYAVTPVEAGTLAVELRALAAALRAPPTALVATEYPRVAPSALRQWAVRANVWAALSGKSAPPDAADLRWIACLLFAASEDLEDLRTTPLRLVQGDRR